MKCIYKTEREETNDEEKKGAEAEAKLAVQRAEAEERRQRRAARGAAESISLGQKIKRRRGIGQG